MERLMAWATRYPRAVLFAVLAISLAAALQLPRLEIAISPQALVIEGDPNQQFYDDTLATFGSDRITVVFISDPNLFEPDKLAAVGEAIENIEQLPFVDKTRSLFNVPDIRVDGDLVSARPFLETLPSNEREAEAIRSRALQNPFVRKNLLSLDKNALAINIYLKEEEYRHDPDFDVHVSEAIQDAIAPLSGIVKDSYQIGLPYVRSAIAQAVSGEQFKTIGSAFLVLLLSLLLMFRRATAIFVPLVTAALSVLWLLGAMSALGIPLSVLTAIVPVLLVVIGSTEDAHLLAEYYDGVSRRLHRRRAVRNMIRRLGLAVSLTFLTSYLGFLSISANPIALVREFGLIASSGLAINFLLTVVLVPVLLNGIGEKTEKARRGAFPVAYAKSVGAITKIVLRYRRFVLALSVAVVVGGVIASSTLQVNNNIMSYLEDDSPLHERIRKLRANLAGVYTIQVVVDGHIDGALERVRYLEELQSIQEFVSQHPAFDHSISFADYMAMLNSAVNDTGRPELPYEDDVVEALMLFVGPEEVREYLSEDRSKASIVIRHGIAESAALGKAIEDLKGFIASSIDPDLSVTVTGQTVLSDNAVDYLIKGQLLSLGLILAAIFVVVSMLFVTAKAGLIAVAINIVPIVGLFAVMGVLGIPVDSATTMIAAIAVGVGVDHTIHFMVRYNRHFRGQVDELDAVARTIKDEAKPIGVATVALAAGFGTLSMSNFPPIYYFGLLGAMTMGFAFVATFLLAPVLLSYVRLMTVWDLLGTRIRRDLRDRCALFRGMRPLQIRRVILLGRVSHLQDGDAIMRRGEVGEGLYVLLRGNVAVETTLADGNVERVEVARFGEIFGVAALMCGMPRVATARAIGEVEVLALDWQRLQRLARFFPRSAYLLFKNLAAITGERLASRGTLLETKPLENSCAPRSVA